MVFSHESEQSVIGAILNDPDAYCRIQGILQENDFHRHEHRLVFSAIKKLQDTDKPSDVVTVGEQLDAAGELDAAGGLPYLITLTDNTPSAANIQAYADIVKAKARLRALHQVCANTIECIKNAQGKSADEIIAETQTTIDSILTSTTTQYSDWMDVLSKADDAIIDAAKKQKEGVATAIPTGLPAIDNRIGGLPQKRLVILAARPSLGKTALAQQIALHASKRGHPVGICTLEMSVEELGIRSYSNLLEINGTALTFGDKSVIDAYTKKLSGSNIFDHKMWIDESTYSLGGIVARAHEWKHKHGIKLLIVDHIGLVESPGESANYRIAEVTRTLKKLTKRLDISVLALCQLNRNVEREKRRPRLSDLRDSGNIEQDADICIFLHSDNEDENEATTDIDIGILKTRFGKKGWLPAHFQFDGRIQRFKELTDHPEWA